MHRGTQRLPGLVLTDHHFDVPLQYDLPDGERIGLYAREAVAPGREQDDLPWMVFLQGGPGFGAPRPVTRAGWLGRALKEYRVLLLDQRGTGQSSPVTHESITRFEGGEAQADYLSCFRADSIVRDCEHVRRELLGDSGRWTVLGQSYGGFCIVSYLSFAPGGLRETIITGGIPPHHQHPDDIYRATYRRVVTQNERYYARYPGDVARVREIVDYLGEHEVRLPGGGVLSPRRFQQLGLAFGFSDGFEEVHYLIEQAFIETASGRVPSHGFLRGVEHAQHYETNPIFAVLHEAAYCQGFSSNWSAERIRAEFPQFKASGGDRVLFTGEMIYPWMFDEYPRLRPMKEAAEILAAREDWPPLYDADALRANEIPCVAAIYCDDMYVDGTFSEETAEIIGGIKTWITNEYQHNGLRTYGETVLDRLLELLHGER